jgi:hypothetical protein
MRGTNHVGNDPQIYAFNDSKGEHNPMISSFRLAASSARIRAACCALTCGLCLNGSLWSQANTYPWPSIGAVGIGTSNPSLKLEVNGAATNNGMALYSGANSNYTFLALGRAGFEAMIAMPAGPGQFSPTAAAGDLVIRSEGKNILFTTDSGSTNQMYLKNGGNVGIGTSTPNALLSLGGSAGIKQLIYDGNADYNAGFGVNLGQAPNAMTFFMGYGDGNSGTAQSTNFSIVSANHSWPFGSDFTTRFTVTHGGNVGIGTTNPSHLLSVAGIIGAREVVVTATEGADYVFKPGYRLKPLNEVAAFIKEHHHLPEIPSEAEVKEKGVDLGDMQTKLLAKVEELTLHMIQADERNNRLEQQNRELHARITRLEARNGKK